MASLKHKCAAVVIFVISRGKALKSAHHNFLFHSYATKILRDEKCLPQNFEIS